MRNPFALIVAAGIFLLCLNVNIHGQQPVDSINKALDLPSRYYDKIQDKFSRLDKRLTSHSEKYLKRLEKKEQKFFSKFQNFKEKPYVPYNMQMALITNL